MSVTWQFKLAFEFVCNGTELFKQLRTYAKKKRTCTHPLSAHLSITRLLSGLFFTVPITLLPHFFHKTLLLSFFSSASFANRSYSNCFSSARHSSSASNLLHQHKLWCPNDQPNKMPRYSIYKWVSCSFFLKPHKNRIYLKRYSSIYSRSWRSYKFVPLCDLILNDTQNYTIIVSVRCRFAVVVR